MKISFRSLAAASSALLISFLPAFGGNAAFERSVTEPESGVAEVASNDFVAESSYVGESEFERGNGRFGEQDAWHHQVYYGHRMPLSGNWYLKLGAKYGRFDFGESNGPVPNHLQVAAAVISVEYRWRGTLGGLLETSPGVYFQNDVNGGTFDAPTNIGLAYPIFGGDSFFLVVGATFSILREYPALPIIGVAWRINENLDLRGFLPEPRLIYRPANDWELWVGGELTGGSFRTDDNKFSGRHSELNDARVDYSEYRGGAGVVFKGFRPFTVDIGGGYAFQRNFNYHSAEEEYTLEGAPYGRVQLRAEF